MRFDKLTIKAQEALADALELASQHGHAEVTSLHLLHALAGQEQGAVASILQRLGMPAEQVQAAKATEEITRGEAVGATASWTSETRENVSGSSTVASINQEGGGRKCMTVNDFIIVDGEETQVSKRMCKGPGESRYVLAA